MSEDLIKTYEIKEFGDLTLPAANYLFTYALLITGDDRKAEKLVLRTYEEAFSFFPNLSLNTNIKLWLFRILIKIFHDEFSTDESEIKHQDISQEIDITKLNIEALEQEPSFKVTQQLISEISSLPFNLKEILILKDVIKFDIDTIANQIDIPKGTIKNRVFDARKSLLIKLLQKNPEVASAKNDQLSYEDKKSITSFIEDEEDLDEKLKDNLKKEIDVQILIKSYIERNLNIQPNREEFKVQLANQFASGKKDELENKYSGENKRLVTGATIAMIILIAVLILVSRPTVVSQGEMAKEQVGRDNIFVQLKNNFSQLRLGKYSNNLVTGDKEHLNSFLTHEGFESEPVYIDNDNWNLRYCFITEFEDKKASNYLYKKSNGDSLYVYQVPVQLLNEKKFYKLSDKLLEFLDSRQCFSSRKGNTLYLLKKTETDILGFVVSLPNKDLIIELCTH